MPHVYNFFGRLGYNCGKIKKKKEYEVRNEKHFDFKKTKKSANCNEKYYCLKNMCNFCFGSSYRMGFPRVEGRKG